MKKFNLAQSVLWNLLGSGLPLAISIFTIPKLISGFGDDRFGLLTLIWAVIGYFSIFDFGMGRALTKLVSEKLGGPQAKELPDLIKTSLIIISLLGVLAAVILLSTSSLITNTLKVSENLRIESINAIRVLALSVPLVVLQAALIGLLEAHRAFKEINIIRLFLGILNFVSPLVALYWSNDLMLATILLAISRLISVAFYTFICYQINALTLGTFRIELLSSLFKYGAWLTASNIISPLMLQLDRFIIGSLISVSAIAYYTVPVDMVNKLGVAPVALISVMFPIFSNIWGTQQNQGKAIFESVCKIMLLGMIPMSVTLILFAQEAFDIWLGQKFADTSRLIFQCLVVGFFVNSVARLPHALLQSTGHPNITAKLHIIELPIYVALLFTLLHYFGVMGAAVAWTARMVVDLVLLFIISGRVIPEIKKVATKYLYYTMILALLMFGLTFIHQIVFKVPILVGTLSYFLYSLLKHLNLFQRSYKQVLA
ncbi:flippase [Dyadobacter alkalitolerans]|uniref:flippase n=1 Tax=Dyadobacter alkalitolerans TaxID=492736 RepID=UPI000410ED51|nr:flippase [Dyadobacter alkalitolerans]